MPEQIQAMTKQTMIESFDPNGVGLDNGHFIGLPFGKEEASIYVMTMPWDVTVSYGAGTALGPSNTLNASLQLDLYEEGIEDAWKMGIYVEPPSKDWLETSKVLRKQSEKIVAVLESGTKLEAHLTEVQSKINQACEGMVAFVKAEALGAIKAGKLVGLLGGDHSTPLGLLQALATQHDDFGVLQIDAHCDLRQAYEGFEYSHASIFYNAMKLPQISKLIQVGIRDYCEAEVAFAKQSDGRIEMLLDASIQRRLFEGTPYRQIVEETIAKLPQKVYISFDIDGLDPKLCPNTGTPVPGGLAFQEAIFWIQKIVQSGRQIIGFDLCEVGGKQEWDGNVAARLLYKLCNWMGKSNGLQVDQ